ncbi:MAG: porin family protein [candidate division Zixibacteria bacterium]|nr:porin family protein [candidate division Zixibacteria bacterium]
MKKLMMILAILVAFGVSASAQVPSSPVSFYAGGALSIPSGPDSFKETFKNGYHGMAGVGFDLNPMFELVGKLEYHAFQFDFTDDMSEYSGGTNKMWMYGVDVKLSPSLPALPIKPYALAGLGMASISMSEFSGPASLSLSVLNSAIGENQTKMYWNLGVGFNMMSTPVFSLFAQARYVNVATEGESAQFIPITIGAKFF